MAPMAYSWCFQPLPIIAVYKKHGLRDWLLLPKGIIFRGVHSLRHHLWLAQCCTAKKKKIEHKPSTTLICSNFCLPKVKKMWAFRHLFKAKNRACEGFSLCGLAAHAYLERTTKASMSIHHMLSTSLVNVVFTQH